MITEEEIEAARTPNGGWTRAQLSKWSLPWPPPKGWKTEIIKTGKPYQHKQGEQTPEQYKDKVI